MAKFTKKFNVQRSLLEQGRPVLPAAKLSEFVFGKILGLAKFKIFVSAWESCVSYQWRKHRLFGKRVPHGKKKVCLAVMPLLFRLKLRKGHWRS